MVDELAVASILLTAVALISCLSVANKRTIRRMPRGAWVAAILLVPLGGATAWFLLGRPLSLRTTPRLRRGPAPTPDDDPGFLNSLSQFPAPAAPGDDPPPGDAPPPEDAPPPGRADGLPPVG